MNTNNGSWRANWWLTCERAIAGLNQLQPAALLLARLHVANVFFSAGLTKLNDWDTTLALFTDEYQVPWLSPTVAAFLGTGGELLLPILLALGLGGRFAAAGLFVLNATAVISLGEVAPAAFQQHLFWGSLLAVVLLWGPGAWSLDWMIAPRLRARWLGAAALAAPRRGAAPRARG